MDKVLVDKLMTFGLINLPFNCPSDILGITAFSYNVLFTTIGYAFCNLNTILQFRTILFKDVIPSAENVDILKIRNKTSNKI